MLSKILLIGKMNSRKDHATNLYINNKHNEHNSSIIHNFNLHFNTQNNNKQVYEKYIIQNSAKLSDRLKGGFFLHTRGYSNYCCCFLFINKYIINIEVIEEGIKIYINVYKKSEIESEKSGRKKQVYKKNMHFINSISLVVFIIFY